MPVSARVIFARSGSVTTFCFTEKLVQASFPLQGLCRVHYTFRYLCFLCGIHAATSFGIRQIDRLTCLAAGFTAVVADTLTRYLLALFGPLCLTCWRSDHSGLSLFCAGRGAAHDIEGLTRCEPFSRGGYVR